MPHRYLNISDLTVDLHDRRVTRDGVDLDLRGLTFDLFAALIRRRGDEVTLQDLVNDVWRGEAVTNEVITQRVRLLRRALGDDPAQPRYIETRRQKGYRLCAPVVVLDAPEVATIRAAASPRRLGVAALMCAAIALAVVLWPREVVRAPDPLLDRARTYAATGQGDDNLRAIDLFEQKLAASPDHYGATLGLSFAYSQRVCRHDGRADNVARARALAERLLATNPANSEAISALAYAEDCAGHIDAALAGYLRAFELDTTQLDALASASHLLQVKGELARALENNLFVERHDDGRALRYLDIQIARCLELMTFDQAAGARYSRTVKLYPDNLFAAMANVRFLMAHGELDEAHAAAERSVRLGAASADLRLLQSELAFLRQRPREVERMLSLATAATQTSLWPDSAREILMPGAMSDTQLRDRVRELQREVAGENVWPLVSLHLAVLHAHLGESQAALVALSVAIDRGYRDAAYLEASPLLAGLRELAGYDDQLRRLRAAASAERDLALAAAWWSPALIDPDAL